MGLFDKLLKRYASAKKEGSQIIAAIADGELIDVHTVNDPVFSQEMLGKSTAFRFDGDKTVLCSPVTGTLNVLFPTGHAYGVTTDDGLEILVHCGINTVNAKGNGFRILNRKQGDHIRTGDPVVEIDLDLLGQMYDMTTILIITNAGKRTIEFIRPQSVTKGQTIIQ